MRGSGLLLLILTLPLLAAIGHDVYLFVTNGGSVEVLEDSLHATLNETGEPGVKSLLASLGYIWTHYEPESYKWTVENTDAQTWSVINFILAQKAVLVTGVFAAFFYVLFLVLGLMGVGEQETSIASSSKRRIDQILNPGKKQGTKFKYKRK